jgi:DNA-binding MarR family transcriptional regulator
MEEKRTKDELVEATLQLGDKAFRELFPILPKEWLNLDLTAGQLKTLLILYVNGSARMSDIASALGVSLPTSTGVLDRMVEQGMVVRENDPGDRRVVICRLSPKGGALLTGLVRLARDRAEVMLRALDRPKLLAVRAALEALLEAGEATKGQWQHD